MVLKKYANDFKLHIIGKDVIADDLDLSFDKSSCLWSALTKEIRSTTPERTDILRVILENGEPISTGEIASKLNKSTSTISTILKKLENKSEIVKVGFGKYSLPNIIESIEIIESN